VRCIIIIALPLTPNTACIRPASQVSILGLALVTGRDPRDIREPPIWSVSHRQPGFLGWVLTWPFCGLRARLARGLTGAGRQQRRDPRRGLGSCEEFVHDFGAGGDDRPQFAAVDDLGGPGGGVPGQASDFLDADAAVAEQADERGPQFAGRPAVPGPGLGADAFVTTVPNRP
jgi:hypothetical protein